MRDESILTYLKGPTRTTEVTLGRRWKEFMWFAAGIWKDQAPWASSCQTKRALQDASGGARDSYCYRDILVSIERSSCHHRIVTSFVSHPLLSQVCEQRTLSSIATKTAIKASTENETFQQLSRNNVLWFSLAGLRLRALEISRNSALIVVCFALTLGKVSRWVFGIISLLPVTQYVVLLFLPYSWRAFEVLVHRWESAGYPSVCNLLLGAESAYLCRYLECVASLRWK